MFSRLCWILVVVGLSEGFTPSASAGGSGGGAGVNGNLVDRTWDPLEPSEVSSYYPGHRQWNPPAGPPIPHLPNNYGVSLPPIAAPSCWSTPSIAGAAIVSVLAIGALIAVKLPLMLLAPAALTLLALPLALPLIAPVLALAFLMPMPTDDPAAPENAGMVMMLKPSQPDDPKKPLSGDKPGGNDAKPEGRGSPLWSALNEDGQKCLQKVACQLGRHAGDSGMWMVKKLPETEWTLFREAYLEGSKSANLSDSACGRFPCSAKGALAAMSAASGFPGT